MCVCDTPSSKPIFKQYLTFYCEKSPNFTCGKVFFMYNLTIDGKNMCVKLPIHFNAYV